MLKKKHSSLSPPKLLIAGGGTGGHLYSGLAVGEEWKRRGGDAVFAGTEKGLEKTIVPKYGFPLELIPVGALKGKGISRQVKTFLGLPMALIKSFFILGRIKPDIVLGIGGYASGPLVLAALLKKIPAAVLDQNSVPGLTNRVLGWKVQKIFLNFETASSYFPGRHVTITGNPVMRERLGPGKILSKQGATLLVCGGSQGAHAINEKIWEALPLLKKQMPRIRVIHQTGVADAAAGREKLAAFEVDGIAAPFFDNLEEHYRAARLVVARAGAGTLTELAAWGLPSILVPYPHASDGHQLKNAAVFARADAAEILEQKDLTGPRLAEKIGELMGDEEKMRRMSEAALKLHKPDAASVVVDELMRMIGNV